MKKLVSSVLAASMVLSLAACGSSASTDTASSSEAASTSTAATTEAAGEGSGAYTGTPIKIGGIGPITGGAAIYGQAVKNAEELAVKEINAANGSDVFEWKFEDDEHDAEKSVNAYNTLKDWGLQVLAGPVTTTPSIAVAAETANDNLFMMTPSASAPAVIESGDNVFQICFTDPNQGVASADYIAENKLGTKVGIIYDSSDAYSSGIYEKFKAEADAKGLEIVAAEAFTADNKSDLSTQVAKCQQAGADRDDQALLAVEAVDVLFDGGPEGGHAALGREMQLAGEVLQVAARHEMIAGALHHHHPQVVPPGELGGGVGERMHHLEGQRVERLRTVEGERRDAVCDVEQDGRSHERRFLWFKIRKAPFCPLSPDDESRPGLHPLSWQRSARASGAC